MNFVTGFAKHQNCWSAFNLLVLGRKKEKSDLCLLSQPCCHFQMTFRSIKSPCVFPITELSSAHRCIPGGGRAGLSAGLSVYQTPHSWGSQCLFISPFSLTFRQLLGFSPSRDVLLSPQSDVQHFFLPIPAPSRRFHGVGVEYNILLVSEVWKSSFLQEWNKQSSIPSLVCWHLTLAHNTGVYFNL